MSAAATPEGILRDLANLWVDLAKEKNSESGVLRACAMTLMLIADESDDAAAIGETIATLMPEHPSRAIVIRVRESAERSLEARVFAQCWMPFGQRQQICCEQIEIMASDGSLPDLPALALPLAVPDLPVILWCRSRRVSESRDFPRLAGMAQKVIVDTAGTSDPIATLQRLSSQPGGKPWLADLSWTRLTRLRQLVSQIFQNSKYLAELGNVTEVRVEHTGTHPGVGAWYAAAWLLDSLDAAGVRPRLQMAAAESTAAVSAIHLLPGFSVRRIDDQTAEIQTASVVNRTSYPKSTEYSLLREELSIPGRDPSFERTLASAVRLALKS